MTDNEEVQLDLSRKYRPRVLDDYIGNAKMVSTIRNAFNRESLDNVPHKIMLTGSTGCGKTTMARILVRSFMCENPRNGMPCEGCEFCEVSRRYVETGDDSELGDLTEVDVTHTRSVDAIQDIIDTMQYEPTQGRYSVFLFDEFHAASRTAQDAMLKRIEDLDDFVVVIFCTTDRERVLPTLINRMNLDLTVVKPPMVELMELLGSICAKEGFKWDKEGLRQLCISSNFIIRSSLMNLERVLRSHGVATGDAVEDEFDIVRDGAALEFIEALVENNYAKYQTLLYEMEVSGRLGMFVNTLKSVVTRGILVMNGVRVEGLGVSELRGFEAVFKRFKEWELARVLMLLNRLGGNVEVLDLLTLQYSLIDEAKERERLEKGRSVGDREGDGGKVEEVDEGEIGKYAKKKMYENSVKSGEEVKKEATKRVTLSELLG